MLIKQQQNHLVEQITTAEIIQSLCKKSAAFAKSMVYNISVKKYRIYSGIVCVKDRC